MRPIDFIVIHCSATENGLDIGRAEIDSWHRQRGFDGIGYHFVIRCDGTIERGRSLDRIGAHAQGHNSYSIGVCLVGGLDANGDPDPEYSDEQWEALFVLVTALQMKHPTAIVLGHRDLPGVNKACPCFDTREWWSRNKEAYIESILNAARG